ncbi:MAG: HIT family protein [Chloroflexi bacterium]|nr:HIT family protein [Chloroflexota bacterium]MYF78528.1 HIT family protein [Chloroflexota bacterium]MYK61735.1 HIT family protein [Chloroflexota bacterium]
MPIELPQGSGDARRGRQTSPDDPCFFCEVIAGREEKGIVEETDQTLTFVNWQQFELGQVYVIPRRHAPTLFDLTDEESTAIMRAVRRVGRALLKAYDPDGLNLIQNNGVVAGQSVPHFHMHVVPRRKEGSEWGNGPPHIAVLEGNPPTKPSRDVVVSLEREYEIADEIRRHLPQSPS